MADIKYGALAEVEDALKRKQAEARRADRMLSDTVRCARCGLMARQPPSLLG